MSWTAVRPYFSAILESREYRDWEDAFAVDNIPESIMDKSFHVGVGPATGIKQNQLDQVTEFTVTLRMYFKGYRTPREALDLAIAEAEAIMKECVKVSDVGGRVSTAGILNVVFEEAAFDPISATNDNAVVVTSNYTVTIIVGANEP